MKIHNKKTYSITVVQVYLFFNHLVLVKVQFCLKLKINLKFESINYKNTFH